MATMTSEEWTVWLGPAAGDLDEDQRARFEVEAQAAIERIGDDADLQAEREAALSAIVQYLLGDLTPAAAGEARARTAETARYALLASQAVARLAVQDGMPEAAAARAVGVDRQVVRRVLGK